ncbi:hypothetical protein [Escherichia coli]|uniref:hypothetical protein n=1 Tax=Escherichia coli TaxID=562 RepID=UPI000DFA5D6E|nr:hypothetical protein [Escherichia coli]STF08928.1 Uncharacterised protein [Escherichia coli]
MMKQTAILNCLFQQYLKGTCLLNHNHLQINRQNFHVIIRPTEGGMQPETDEVKVKFLLGGFCEDHTGYEWVMALLERMMFHFQEKPLLEEKFLFQGDIRWRMFDDQPYPYWITEATGTWLVLKPQNIQSQEFI